MAPGGPGVDAAERRRHDRIAELQGNRNPFIDRPELADLLWPMKRIGDGKKPSPVRGPASK
jgi:hypothetical protein